MGDASSKLESSESDISDRQSLQTTPTSIDDDNRGHRTDSRTVSKTLKVRLASIFIVIVFVILVQCPIRYVDSRQNDTSMPLENKNNSLRSLI